MANRQKVGGNKSPSCGHPLETAEYFLLFCPSHHHIRIDTNMHIEDNYLDIQTLPFGKQSLGVHQNEFIFKNLHEFKGQTRRF